MIDNYATIANYLGGWDIEYAMIKFADGRTIQVGSPPELEGVAEDVR